MIKKHKWTLLITSITMLLPMVLGLFFWNRLPERVPMHWNFAGEADSWGSRSTVVYIMPLVMLGIHWLCFICTCLDPKSKENQGKVMSLVLWICPIISLIISILTYGTALGYELSVPVIMNFCLGFLFLVIGNYLPKCKHNYTIGIKTPWTLNNEENWVKTHRFSGKVWVVCSVAIMALSFLGNFIILLSVVSVMVFAPLVYSYMHYRRHGKEE